MMTMRYGPRSGGVMDDCNGTVLHGFAFVRYAMRRWALFCICAVLLATGCSNGSTPLLSTSESPAAKVTQALCGDCGLYACGGDSCYEECRRDEMCSIRATCVLNECVPRP